MHHSYLHPGSHYPLAFLLLGVLLLFLGRRLFWLFVGAAGFIGGVLAAPYILPHQGELFTLVIALILGVLGALLAIFVQKLAVAIAGFCGGGALAVVLGAPLLGGTGFTYPGAWLCFLIGGLVGLVLMLMFFNWALIILSSLDGAHLVIRGITPILGSRYLPRHHYPILFILLAVIGIAVQAATYRRRPVAKAE